MDDSHIKRWDVEWLCRVECQIKGRSAKSAAINKNDRWRMVHLFRCGVKQHYDRVKGACECESVSRDNDNAID